MAFFNKRPKTSKQKAQKAQLNILARLLGSGYLLYIIYQMVTTPYEEDGMNPTLKIVVVTFFLCAAITLIVFTVIELVRNYKAGVYKEASYEDDPGVWTGALGNVANLTEETEQTEQTDDPPETDDYADDDDADDGDAG